MGEYEAACKRGEIQTKDEQIKQARQEQSKPTFAQYVELYMAEKSAVLAPITLPNYRNILTKAAAVLGNMRLEDITVIDVKQYISNLQLNGKSEHDGKPLAHGTVIQHYVTIKAFFDNAVENEILLHNPMQNMKPPKPSKEAVETKEVVVYTEKACYVFKSIMHHM